MRAVLVGLGAVGTRAARQLLSSNSVSELVVLSRRPAAAQTRVAALGAADALQLEQLTDSNLSNALSDAAVTLLATPGPCLSQAEASVRAAVPVVSTTDDTREARALLALDERAKAAGVAVAVGAGLVPGLSCLLAAWAAQSVDELSEVHIASLGTGGPACARRHHAALRESVEEWRDGAWVRRVASSGRELVWFPDHTEADCYRVNRPDLLVLTRAFPQLTSATTRAAATRREPYDFPATHVAPAPFGGDGRGAQGGGARAENWRRSGHRGRGQRPAGAIGGGGRRPGRGLGR